MVIYNQYATIHFTHTFDKKTGMYSQSKSLRVPVKFLAIYWVSVIVVLLYMFTVFV